MTNLESKLPGVGDTIFAEMTELANKHDAINLSQGFPNFGSPQELIDRVYHHMKTGRNQYPPMPGLSELKNKLAEKMEGLYDAVYDPDSEITITAGATQALQMTITALVHEGDEVIILDPAYDIYDPCVRLNGGNPVHYNLMPPDYQVDWSDISDLITDRTTMIVVNNPHNPSGTIFDQNDIHSLTQLVDEHDLWILSDEVYQHMVYDGYEHQSICRYPALRERGLAAFSFGKTYHTTGWKVGYLAAPEYLTEEFRKVFQYGQFAVSSPMQYAFADYLERSQHYLELGGFYQQKRDLFQEIIEQSRFELLPCEGTYFQCVSYKNISDKSDSDFVKELIEEHGVAAIPVSPFYHDGTDEQIIRFCFAKTEETLQKAGEKLVKI